MSRLIVLALLAAVASFIWMHKGRSPASDAPAAPITPVLAAAADPVETTPGQHVRVLSAEAPLIPGAGSRPETPARPSPDPQVRYVSASNLRMRAGPTVKARFIGSYPHATPMIVEERSGNWYRVRAPDGQTGWMATKYLSQIAPEIQE